MEKKLEEKQDKVDNKKKPYTPPAVIEEASFEGFALKCGQVDDACGGGAAGGS